MKKLVNSISRVVPIVVHYFGCCFLTVLVHFSPATWSLNVDFRLTWFGFHFFALSHVGIFVAYVILFGFIRITYGLLDMHFLWWVIRFPLIWWFTIADSLVLFSHCTLLSLHVLVRCTSIIIFTVPLLSLHWCFLWVVAFSFVEPIWSAPKTLFGSTYVLNSYKSCLI